MILTCSRCQVQKSASLFPKAKTCRTGHRSHCKDCDKVRKDAWRAKDPTKHNAKSRAWAAANPEKRRATRNKWNAANQEKCRELKRQARALRPVHYRADVGARRQKFRQCTPPWVDMEAIRKVYEQAIVLGLTVDHIVPIKHDKVCGLHVPWNLQIISREANTAKSNMFEGTRPRPHGGCQ